MKGIRGATIVGLAAAAGLLSVAALKLLPIPFAWIDLFWCVPLVAASVAATRPWLKMAGVLAVTLCVTGSAGEVLLTTRLPPEIKRSQVPAHSEPDPVMGWRLASPRVSRNIMTSGGQTVYDVHYTVADGRRLAPPQADGPPLGCVAFLADSFTFGVGVKDEEAFPYRVGVLTNGRYRIVNLAVPGYGIEQVVASLEHGLFAKQSPCQPDYVIYLALPHHVLRSAGRTKYSAHSPRYALDASGAPVYQGTPPPPRDPTRTDKLLGRGLEQLDKSNLYRLLTSAPEPRPTEGEIRLYFALVRRAAELLARQYPSAQFHILAWGLHDWFGGGVARFRAGLLEATPRVHYVEEFLPRYRESPYLYALDPQDEHPNARAHEVIAAYVAEHILGTAARP